MAGIPAVVDIPAGANVLSAVFFLASLPMPLLVSLLLLVPLFLQAPLLLLTSLWLMTPSCFQVALSPYYCPAVADVLTFAGVPPDFGVPAGAGVLLILASVCCGGFW